MGEHKYNPTAIAAREGKLPPKKKPLSKREVRHIVEVKLQAIMYKPLAEAMTEYFREEKEANDGRS